jgi:hypothetical protein
MGQSLYVGRSVLTMGWSWADEGGQDNSQHVSLLPQVKRLGSHPWLVRMSLGLLLLLLLLLQIRTQPHLGCCLAAATAAAFAIFMHLCTNSATPYTSQQHIDEVES